MPMTETGGGPASARREHDVIVVGAGPAGLACAARLLEQTALLVCVVDAGHGPGGQYWRHPAPTPDAAPLVERTRRGLHHDLDTFDALTASLERGRSQGRLETRFAHHVWSVVPTDQGYAVHAVDRGHRPGQERAATVAARALVIATGAYDRSLPFPGWDLPGVMTVGGLQALLKGGDVAAGRRVAIGGTGPFLLPVATALASRGATVVGLFEANRPTRWLGETRAVVRNLGKLREGAGYAAALLRHRVPAHAGRMIVAAHGTDRVDAVSVARLDRSGHPIPTSTRRLDVDAVGVGWGFTPQLDLAVTLGLRLTPDAGGTPVVAVDRLHRTSREGVYAAGETCGVGGADLALVEGRLAARAVAIDLGAPSAPDTSVASSPDADALTDSGAKQAEAEQDQAEQDQAEQDQAEARRGRVFADAIMRAHPVPAGWADLLDDDTVVCRCEEVRYGAVRAAIEGGATDARQVKQLTRTGMGWCQGRVCGYAASLLSGGTPGPAEERLVSAPVPLGLVADADGAGPSNTIENNAM